MRKLLFLLVLSSTLLRAADVIPSARLIDWTQSGVPGGIPARTTIYTTLAAGSTSAQIQTAIDNCPDNQTVMLSAGTYSLSSGLQMDNDYMTLRGAIDADGEPTTIFNFQSGAGGWGLIDFSKTTYPTAPSNVRSITSGASQGSTSITLNSAPTGLAVGQIFSIDQIADDNLVWDNGTQGGDTWGRNGNRTLAQFVRVVSIAGSVVTFSPALYSPYWNASQTPEMYWWGTGTSQTVTMSGVENIKLNRNVSGGGSHNIAIGPADSCWVKNVWSTQCDSAHVRTGWVKNIEVRDSYFTLHDSVASATYSVWFSYTSDSKIENNIMYNTPCAVGMMTTSGSFIGYNYGELFPYSVAVWLPECMMTHGGHNHFNLWEGNYIPSFWKDFIHGNAAYDVYARNRVVGWETGKTSSTRPINIEENQDYVTVVGNILGTNSYHTEYATGSNTSIYGLSSDSTPTLIKKGNWNTVDDAINASEALGADTISTSYIYSSKPSWFGSLTWPAYDPLTSPASADGLDIPAGYRFANGAWPAADAGAVLNVTTLTIGVP